MHWITLPGLHLIRHSRKASPQNLMYPLGKVRRSGKKEVTWRCFGILPGRQGGPSPGDIWSQRRPPDCAQHTWSGESEAAESSPRGSGHESSLSFYLETKLPLTPVMQFYLFAREHPAVTPTLWLPWGYGKSSYSQSNFHILSIWPVHWALIWVNESFSCKTRTENMHSLCLQ